MNKKKSKVLAFLLATAIIVPTSNGNIYAATDLKCTSIIKEYENVYAEEKEQNQIKSNCVAKIGNKEYDSLQTAFDEVPNDGTLVSIVIQNNIENLEKPVILGDNKSNNKNVILDMNNKSITVSENFDGRVIENYGTLTIKGSGTISSNNSSNGYGAVKNFGNLTIENGIYKGNIERSGGAVIFNKGAESKLTINNGTLGDSMYIIYNEGYTEINGGNFIGRSCSACRSGNYGYTISNVNKDAKLYINDGYFEGVQGGISIAAGYGEIKNGTFKTIECPERTKKHPLVDSTHYALYVAGENGKSSCIVKGGTFESASRVVALIGNNQDGGVKQPAAAVFDGGTFISGDKNSVIAVDEKKDDGSELGSVEINNGTYNGSVKEFLGEDSELNVERNSNGMYQYFKSIDEAMKNAPSGSTFKDLDVKVEQSDEIKNIELNYNDGTNTIMNLEIVVKDNNGKKEATINLPQIERSGYRLTGWRINGKTYKVGENTVDLSNLDLDNLEISAVWEEIYIPSIPSKPSNPTYTHEKIEGLDRYETAAKIADKLGLYDNVVLVNAESSMSDGLAASGLAGKENGAILLTKKDSIPKATMDRLKKVKKVYIIGGENAISKKVSDEITKNVPNVKVERLGGKTRVETSEIVAKKLGNYSKAFVVNGFKGGADAMSASSVAAKYEAPILLTNGKTSTHAKKSGVEYYVIGGDTVVDKSIATKYDAEVLAGKDRYATNKEVIDEFYSGRDKIYFANGETLVDALTASTLAKKDGIALVNAKSDKSVLKGKDTVQVGGMKFTIDFDK